MDTDNPNAPTPGGNPPDPKRERLERKKSPLPSGRDIDRAIERKYKAPPYEAPKPDKEPRR